MPRSRGIKSRRKRYKRSKWHGENSNANSSSIAIIITSRCRLIRGSKLKVFKSKMNGLKKQINCDTGFRLKTKMR